MVLRGELYCLLALTYCTVDAKADDQEGKNVSHLECALCRDNVKARTKASVTLISKDYVICSLLGIFYPVSRASKRYFVSRRTMRISG